MLESDQEDERAAQLLESQTKLQQIEDEGVRQELLRERDFFIRLFGLHPTIRRKHNGEEWSNSFQSFAALPWFSLSKTGLTKPFSSANQPSRSHMVTMGGVSYELTIMAAPINGQWRDLGFREELVLDALIQLSTTPNGAMVGGRAGTHFTLRGLQRALRYHLNHDQIREALETLRKADTTFRYMRGDGTVRKIEATLLSDLFTVTRDDWIHVHRKDNNALPEEALCFVRFHPLVTEGIRGANYRMIAMDAYHSIKTYIGKRMFKYLTLLFRAASVDVGATTFTLNSRHFLVACGMLQSADDKVRDNRISSKRAQLIKGLQSLIDSGHLLSYRELEPTKSAVKGTSRKIITDYHFELVASELFAKSQRYANHAARDTHSRAEVFNAIQGIADVNELPVIGEHLITASKKGLDDMRQQLLLIEDKGDKAK